MLLHSHSLNKFLTYYTIISFTCNLSLATFKQSAKRLTVLHHPYHLQTAHQMDKSKRTVQIATDVCKKLKLEASFTTTQCHINRNILTRIMTSDQMLTHLGINLSQSNKSFFILKFPTFYSQLHIEKDDPVSITDGINVTRQLLTWITRIDQSSTNPQQHTMNNNNTNNNCNDPGQLNDIQRTNNGKSNKLDNNASSESPSAKKQRQNANHENKDNESLDDQMREQFQQCESELLRSINDKWHNNDIIHGSNNNSNSNSNSKAKKRLLKKLLQIQLKYINSELIFDKHHGDPTRERIKKLLNARVDKRHHQLVMNQGYDNKMGLEIQDDDLFTNSNEPSVDDHLNTELDEFCKEFDDLIEHLNTANDNNEVMENTLNLATKLVHLKHRSGQAQLLFPNIPKIKSQVMTFLINGNNNKNKDIIDNIKSTYNHGIIGHNISNRVYELINIMHLIQFVYDKLTFIWHNNNQMQVNYNDQVKLIKDLQASLPSQSVPSDSVKSDHNNHVDKIENSVQTNNSTIKDNNTSLNNNNMSDGTTIQDNKLNDTSHDVKIKDNKNHINSKELAKSINKLIDKHTDMQELIHECQSLANIAMDMINLLVSIVETVINNCINYSNNYFQQIQTETSTIAYMLYYVISFRLQQIGKIQTQSDNNKKHFKQQLIIKMLS